MGEIIECQEFEELSVRVSSLLEDGELRLDERITSRGYLAATMKGGQITLRTTKYVGTIPLTQGLAVRVRPRATISNLSYMLVRSGIIPSAVSGFSRGYLPRFATTSNVEKIYGRSLVDGIKLIAKRGFMKEYRRPENPAPWRGRLMASNTVRRHASKGIRYRHEFEQSTLSLSSVENIALKAALQKVCDWFQKNDKNNPIVTEAKALLNNLGPVTSWSGHQRDLIGLLGRKIRTLSPQLPHYRDPLWSSLLILQSSVPEIEFDGYVRLDSLIVDVSAVFEAFVRRELEHLLALRGYVVDDGNKMPEPFFRDAETYSVHPDIIVRHSGAVAAILDVKYKPEPKEQDRYEVLSFMDAFGAEIGGFICPANGVHTSRYLGTTTSGKRMFSLRYDLAAVDPSAESERLAQNIVSMLEGHHDFQ